MAVNFLLKTFQNTARPAASSPLFGQVRQMSASVAETIETAQGLYKNHEQSFRKFNVDDIHFKVGSHFINKSPFPEIYYGDAERSGIVHVSPWAKIGFSAFGKSGTLNQKKNFLKGQDAYVTDPTEAEQQVTLTLAPLDGSDGINTEVQDYFDWLEAIREKYIDHLADNVESYDVLRQKLSVLVGKDREVLRGMLGQICNQVTRTPMNEMHELEPERQTLTYRQKFYFPTQKKTGQILCDLDQEMLDLGYQRKHIPLFDSAGAEIPLEKSHLAAGDVVSVQSNVTCQLYNIGGNVGAGLRRTMRAAVLLLQKDTGSSGSSYYQSPFSGSAIEGGVVQKE